jgi:hypothetical protein
MRTVDVACEPAGGGWTCRVRVDDERGAATEHEVRVPVADLRRLAPEAIEPADPTDLVRRSFDFLLEREPKESILRSFELGAIGRYFPEYEVAIRAAG